MVSGFGSRGFGTRARLDDQPDAAQLYLFIGDGSGTRRPGRKQGHTLFSFLLPSLFPACVFGADRASPFPISIDCAARRVCCAVRGWHPYRPIASSPALHSATGTGVYLPGEFTRAEIKAMFSFVTGVYLRGEFTWAEMKVMFSFSLFGCRYIV